MINLITKLNRSDTEESKTAYKEIVRCIGESIPKLAGELTTFNAEVKPALDAFYSESTAKDIGVGIEAIPPNEKASAKIHQQSSPY